MLLAWLDSSLCKDNKLVRSDIEYMTKQRKTRSKVFYHTRLLCIVSIAMVLLILGVLALIEIAGDSLGRKVEEQISFNLLLKEGSTEEENKALYEQLTKEDFTQEVRYISAANALEEIKKELGEDPVLLLGYNPLQAQMQVHIKSAYTSRDSLPIIDAKIRSLNGVESLSYRQDLLEIVQGKIKIAKQVLLILAIALLVISFIQINNTTRLLIYGKRYHIRTLSLVGASAGFIRRPFVWQGLLDGFLAAVLADILLFAVLWALWSYQVPDLWDYLPVNRLLIGAAALVGVGSLISAFTAYRSARRYIRIDGSKMHLI